MARQSLNQPGGTTGSSQGLTPTATKTVAYTAVVGDLALMNVAGGGTALTLPTAPADKAQVAYRAIGATTSAPLTVTAGGSDTIGLSGATTSTIALADETVVLQYQAAGTRWLAVANVKTQTSLDGRYAAAIETVNAVAAAGASQTIPDPSVAGNATMNRLVLSAATCTLTFPTPVAGASFTVILVQDATGGRLVTWPGSVNWGGAGTPVLSTAATKEDWFVFSSATGVQWKGFLSGQGF